MSLIPKSKLKNKVAIFKNSARSLEAQPSAIAHLSSQTAVKLVETLGAEECQELLPYMTTEQTLCIYDNELWRTVKRGGTPTLDRASLECWMRIWHDLGDEFACKTLVELGTPFVAAFLNIFSDITDVATQAFGLIDLEPESEKGIDTFDELLFQTYCVRTKISDAELREIFVHLLNLLWELEPDFFLQTLALCLRHGLDERDLHVRTIKDELLDNAAQERDHRRSEQGHMEGETATELWFKILTNENDASLRQTLIKQESNMRALNAAPEENTADDDKDRLLARSIEVELQQFDESLLLIGSTALGDTPNDIEKLLREISLQHFHTAVLLQKELAMLANMLMATFQFEEEKLKPEIALQMVLKTCEFALAPVQDKVEFLRQHFLLGAFRDGVQRLHNSVTLEAAKRLDSVLKARRPEHEDLRQMWIDRVLQKNLRPSSFYDLLRARRFQDANWLLNKMLPLMQPRMGFALKCCFNDFPVLPLFLTSQRTASKWTSYRSPEDVSAIHTLLSALERDI